MVKLVEENMCLIYFLFRIVSNMRGHNICIPFNVTLEYVIDLLAPNGKFIHYGTFYYDIKFCTLIYRMEEHK
jgi:hypothetical protein